MVLLYVLLLVLAVVCFAAAAARKSFGNLDLVGLGLFFAFLVPLIQFLKQL
jgi:hypothetical protein